VSELLLAPICETGAEDDPIYSYLKWVENTKTRHEHARMLYVAATRARRQLHLLGHTGISAKKQCVNAPDNRTLLHKIWPAVEDDFQRAYNSQFAPGPVLVSEPETARPGILLRRVPADWQLPALPPDVAWRGSETERAVAADLEEPPITFEWVGATQRHVGTVVHATLQRLAAHPELAGPDLA
jgi:ATP-dependent exoDNAse (exonuclease V) beta subunit